MIAARELYAELIDAGFEEAELERKIGEGSSIEVIYSEAQDDGYFD